MTSAAQTKETKTAEDTIAISTTKKHRRRKKKNLNNAAESEESLNAQLKSLAEEEESFMDDLAAFRKTFQEKCNLWKSEEEKTYQDLHQHYQEAAQRFSEADIDPNIQDILSNMNPDYAAMIINLDHCIRELPLEKALEELRDFHDCTVNHNKNVKYYTDMTGTIITQEKTLLERLKETPNQEILNATLDLVYSALTHYYDRIKVTYSNFDNDAIERLYCDLIENINKHLILQENFNPLHDTTNILLLKAECYLNMAEIKTGNSSYPETKQYLMESFKILKNYKASTLFQRCIELKNNLSETSKNSRILKDFQKRPDFDKKQKKGIDVIASEYIKFSIEKRIDLLKFIPQLTWNDIDFDENELNLFFNVNSNIIAEGWAILYREKNSKNAQLFQESAKRILLSIAQIILEYTEIYLIFCRNIENNLPSIHDEAIHHVEVFLSFLDKDSKELDYWICEILTQLSTEKSLLMPCLRDRLSRLHQMKNHDQEDFKEMSEPSSHPLNTNKHSKKRSHKRKNKTSKKPDETQLNAPTIEQKNTSVDEFKIIEILSEENFHDSIRISLSDSEGHTSRERTETDCSQEQDLINEVMHTNEIQTNNLSINSNMEIPQQRFDRLNKLEAAINDTDKTPQDIIKIIQTLKNMQNFPHYSSHQQLSDKITELQVLAENRLSSVSIPCFSNRHANYKSVIEQLAELLKINEYTFVSSTFNAYLFGSAIYKFSPGDMDIILTNATQEEVKNFINKVKEIGGKLLEEPHRMEKEKRTIYRIDLLGIHIDINFYDDLNMDFTQHSEKTDFTVGAVYYDIRTGEIYYPQSHTQEDIENKELRTVIDPIDSFMVDPTRILRAVRMMSSSKFTLHDETQNAIAELSAENHSIFERVAPNKLFQQMELLFCTGHAVDNLQILLDLNLLPHLFGVLKQLNETERDETTHLMKDIAQQFDDNLKNPGSSHYHASLMCYAACWKVIGNNTYNPYFTSNFLPRIALLQRSNDPALITSDIDIQNKSYIQRLTAGSQEEKANAQSSAAAFGNNSSTFFQPTHTESTTFSIGASSSIQQG